MMFVYRTAEPVIVRVFLSLVVLSLVSCGSNSPAPVEDRRARQASPTAVTTLSSKTTYRVQKGDTLYSIAFRYGLDYRKLAAANNILLPYTIHPGRYLFLREAQIPKAPPAVTRRVPKPVITPPKPPPVTKASVNKRAPAPKPAPVKPKATAEVFVGSKVERWSWPTTGSVTRGYSSSVHKGIDISGKRGDAVEAVAAGKVVYAGTGIVGFGELLIVKHNDIYLSAYGHNDSLLVAEGQAVRAGQKIAEKGSSGTDTVKLHFEIRKAGKPIDPQRLLPKR
ncbi:MAG: lipoprotein NlpD [Halioglobus sp.]|jgi:lipoprotein NlpD